MPEIDDRCCELGSGEEEERRLEDEAGWERLVPWELVAGDLSLLLYSPEDVRSPEVNTYFFKPCSFWLSV